MTSLADLYGDGFSADINWTSGTTLGPVCNISTGTGAAIPIAAAGASGVVNTTTQTIAGVKSFSSAIGANAGITFPATAVTSSDAHTLDDYEEGTWTPTAWGILGTSPTYSGTYTLIGNRMLYEIKIVPGSTKVYSDATATHRMSLPPGFAPSTSSAAPMGDDACGSGTATGVGVGLNYTNNSVYLPAFDSVTTSRDTYVSGQYKIA
jgi:hypothetical protein